MERIKEALQRARRERESESERDIDRKDSSIGRVSPIRIDYKRTKVINAPDKTLRENRIIAGRDDHKDSAAYKILRTQILRRMEAHGWKSLAVTSPAPMEGKSLTAANLAVSMARQFSSTVLLADLDLRRPNIAPLFGHHSAPGLTDHLSKGMALEDVLLNPGIERLVILPGGTPVNNVSELLRSPEMGALVKEFQTRYSNRLVLFDLPPLLVGDEAIGFLQYVDCVLLVVEDGKTHPDHLRRATELLEDANIIGSVLNKCKHFKKNHYYEYY